MSKWIAEFELEDGDTMPEHMDLEYKGTKIDFHCKPLEQDTVPFDFELYQAGLMNMPNGMIDVLDKIRAEIEQLTSRYSISKERGGMGQVEWSDRLIKESDVLQIIDKYKAESEDMSEVGVEIIKTEEIKENGIKYLNINVSNDEVERNPDIVRLCADAGILEYVKPKTGHWIDHPHEAGVNWEYSRYE